MFLAEGIYSWYWGVYGYVILYFICTLISGIYIYILKQNKNEKTH